MPLNFEGLKGDLYAAFTLGEESNPDAQQNLIDQVDAIAKAIEAYVKSGDINGVATVVTGTLTPQGAVTGKGTQTVPVKIQ